MRSVIVSLAVALVSLTAGPVSEAADTVLNVAVTASTPEPRTQVDSATRKALEARVTTTQKARKDLEKEIKRQFGKKEEAWPKDQQNAFFDAQEAEALAVADYEYRRIDPEALSDTAQDLRNSLTGKGAFQTRKDNVILVESPAEADLVIEVVARRGSKSDPTLFRNDEYYISFLIKPGGKMDPARFAKVSRDYRFRKFGYSAWRLQAPKPESPVWRFDAYGIQRWSNAAATASMMINDFIEKNYPALTVGT